MKHVVLQGAAVKIYINNKLYKEADQVSYNIDYGAGEIYGIDSPFPQEIAPGRVSVQGAINGIKIKYSGGLQAYEALPPIADILSSPYISIRIQDRASTEDLLFIPSAMITAQSVQIPARGIYRLSFNFKGLVPFEPLDRS